jgi:Membrane dipeptidase (Peptidase family M19)
MKKIQLVLFIFIFIHQSNAQTVKVYRFYHEGDKDWVTVPETYEGFSKMAEWGYINKEYMFDAYTTRVSNSIAIYNWYHTTEKDWVLLPEGGASDATLTSWGYTYKRLEFYAPTTAGGNTVSINRWYHPIEKDWVHQPANHVNEVNMASWGYQDKQFAFFGLKKTDFLVTNIGSALAAMQTDVTGTWQTADGSKAEFVQDGNHVYCILNANNFKHLVMATIKGNQIRGQISRYDVNSNCLTTMDATWTINGSNSMQVTWKALDGNCDLTRNQTGTDELTRVTRPSELPMNRFSGSSFDPNLDVSGTWGDADWIQAGNLILFINNNSGFKHYFIGTRNGNQITGTQTRINRSNNCLTEMSMTFTVTNANSMQYRAVAKDSRCDLATGWSESNTITRRTNNGGLASFNIATVYPNPNFDGTSKGITNIGSTTVGQLGMPVSSIKVAWGYKAIVSYLTMNKGGIDGGTITRQMEIVGDRETLPITKGKGALGNVSSVTAVEIVAYTPLNGWVDMHTHPASQDAFGGEYFFGGNDGDITNVLGTCICYHDYPPDWRLFGLKLPAPDNLGCRNIIRQKLANGLENHSLDETNLGSAREFNGYPNFNKWPNHNSKLHQQMWWEWIDRARRGGQKVLVALAHNSHCLADASESGRTPMDDKGSMLVQIANIKSLVANHPTIMGIAKNAAEMRSIVQSGRLAIVLGVEMDNIGNFYNPAYRGDAFYNPNPTNDDIINEINELWDNDIRYIFPIHLTNNVFGGAAVYGSSIEKVLFSVGNKYNTGTRFEVESTDSTGWRMLGGRNTIGNRDANDEEAITKLNELYAQCSNDLVPDFIPCRLLYPNQYVYDPPEYSRTGHRNSLGFTDRGRVAIKHMMRKGMLIDIDHMSDKAADEMLSIALQNNYPVNSGHAGPRSEGTQQVGSERSRTNRQYRQIIQTGGMVGIGHGGEATAFANILNSVAQITGYKNIAIGTDVNIEALPAPPATSVAVLIDNPFGLSALRTGNKTWDFDTYNREGVAHYGLMPEYIQSIIQACSNRTAAGTLMKGTEYFAQMWEKCERQKTSVR